MMIFAWLVMRVCRRVLVSWEEELPGNEVRELGENGPDGAVGAALLLLESFEDWPSLLLFEPLPPPPKKPPNAMFF